MVIQKIPFFTFFQKHKVVILFLLILVVHIFFRFSFLFERANFGWDQVDSALGAKEILIDHNLLLKGPVAKGNSGIYMGPLYYFAIAPFYFLTNLDPIASPIFQASLSIVNLLVVFFITKKLFGVRTALVASVINTILIAVMNADRVQSAYYLIPSISYLIFFAIWQIISGKPKYIFLLALLFGLSFHVDFTSVFYPVIILFALPFFPKTKQCLLYCLFSIPIALLFLFPLVLNTLSAGGHTNNFAFLFQTTFHGLHLRRVLQISHDGFITVEQVLQFRFLRPFVFIVPFIFGFLYYKRNPNKLTLKRFYLIGLWIVIPWIFMSTYNGELTEYYFSLPRDIVISMLAYLSVLLLSQKNIFIKAIPVIFWVCVCINSTNDFLYHQSKGNLLEREGNVKRAIAVSVKIEYGDHSPEYFLYYAYKERFFPKPQKK